MYNGVGLPTARGTGTSAHVQRNSAALRRPRSYAPNRTASNTKRAPTKAALAHERRRRVEVEVARREDQLESEGMKRELIDDELGALRDRLLRDMLPTNEEDEGVKTNELVKQMERNEKLKKALGLPEEYEEGAAFQRMNKEQEEEKENEAQVETANEKMKNTQPLPGIDMADSESSSSLSSSSLSESSGIESNAENRGGPAPVRDLPPPSVPVQNDAKGKGRRANRDHVEHWLKHQHAPAQPVPQSLDEVHRRRAAGFMQNNASNGAALTGVQDIAQRERPNEARMAKELDEVHRRRAGLPPRQQTPILYDEPPPAIPPGDLNRELTNRSPSSPIRETKQQFRQRSKSPPIRETRPQYRQRSRSPPIRDTGRTLRQRSKSPLIREARRQYRQRSRSPPIQDSGRTLRQRSLSSSSHETRKSPVRETRRSTTCRSPVLAYRETKRSPSPHRREYETALHRSRSKSPVRRTESPATLRRLVELSMKEARRKRELRRERSHSVSVSSRSVTPPRSKRSRFRSRSPERTSRRSRFRSRSPDRASRRSRFRSRSPDRTSRRSRFRWRSRSRDRSVTPPRYRERRKRYRSRSRSRSRPPIEDYRDVSPEGQRIELEARMRRLKRRQRRTRSRSR